MVVGNVDEIHWDHLDGELRTPAEHCQYKFLGHVEGWAYSGHLKCVQSHLAEEHAADIARTDISCNAAR